MNILAVLENPEECPLSLAGVDTVAARTYLADEAFGNLKNVRIVNICRSYRYQSIGYYVSLLAEARGHRSFPNILTIQDLKSLGLIRLTSEELSELIQKQCGLMGGAKASVNIYFGRTPGSEPDTLAQALYGRFPAPFLVAEFSCGRAGWQLQNVSPLAVKDIPPAEREFAEKAASEWFHGRRRARRKPVYRFDMAILINPQEATPPSNKKALARFAKAARNNEISPEFITRDDAGRIWEFDALFIRETTAVDHHTYRMARKAESEGLVVIDDPVSILRCTNKVFLAELLGRHKIPAPKTRIAHGRNLDELLAEFDFPVVLKQPDSSFSQGVLRADTKDEFTAGLKKLLEKSELVIVQEYTPSDFDWRIGILDGQPLYACKYYMAKKHWQIIHRDGRGHLDEGRVETLPVEFAPPKVVRTAQKAASLIGEGLYGVDLKEHGNKVTVIEINDNPSLDAGFEDGALKDELYERIMRIFLRRLEAAKQGGRR
ncbi:RimK-like ATPgrasp N-terminal domain containing protein [Desulfovibrio sp. X2]|uniref:RimK family alpha-L-glutamate ligase n=1 Tax=Desulfovibrio sp. X2 TaxID=941449 RepID=UPI000358A96F|nr:RimK family alpha-L-glutamate ligase [Desulfovibrio sp. X2]EPR39836.1 RimK-like ATPgrasp N-terminal domain containing protein [Desulfovibrio sp. X2]